MSLIQFLFNTQLRLGVFMIVVIVISACSHTPQSNQLLQNNFEPRQVELEDVPFFPQTQYQCGPAALATVMQYRGTNVLPTTLKDLVYIPEKKGSLQVEMLATTRHYGFIPYLMAPDMTNLLTEVGAGNPVLVMQNLGYSWKPFWHYAVVVGFDLQANTMILRSGETKRWQTTLRTFERTWARSGYWALVIVSPENPPATAQLSVWLESAYAAESTGQIKTAERAYQAAMTFWPNQAHQPGIALANLYYQQKLYGKADAVYQQLTQQFPHDASLRNNRAYTLKAMGCHQTALASAACAVRLDPEDQNIQATFSETLLLPPFTANHCPVTICPK